MTLGNRGILTESGDTMQIKNALVEEVFTANDTTGYILISYTAPSVNDISSILYLRLNVSKNTAIINLDGNGNCLRDIQEGMWVDVVFSPNMTRSIPPQANAFFILARRGAPASTDVSTTRIISVNAAQDSVLTGNPNNINNQTIFTLSNDTLIRNRIGNTISIVDLRPGQTIRVVHGNFQTASIPPQTPAYYIQVL